MFRRLVLPASISILLGCTFTLTAQSSFIPNAGQWDDRVKFRSDISSGSAFLLGNGVRYSFYNSSEVDNIHKQVDSLIDVTEHEQIKKSIIHCYAYEMRFVNTQVTDISGGDKQKSTASYFLGDDESKWRGGLPMYNNATYSALYAGIDLIYYNKMGALKYDFIVAPEADAAAIEMQYTGQSSLAVNNGVLEIGAGFLTVREIIPQAFQYVNGEKQTVKCEYRITGNVVSFVFPDGYNSALELIIDPEVIASTYNGSTAMAFGFTATYDDAGNIFAGGTVFSQGFPVTLGAYDVTYAASWDIGISKFDPNGSNLLYCTYIGGVTEEQPLSMYEHLGNLYVYGTTNSPDFPSTSGAFDQTYDGSHDIIVFCLNANATALLASTFVGSSGDDGVNYININMGDGFRGEIVVNDAGEVYVSSGSASASFPVTPGAYSTSYSGGVDAVIFKMNSTLSTMIWCTFLGASIHDFAMGMRVDAAGFVFVVGTFRGVLGGFPSVAGGYQTTYLGGASDVFVAKFDPSGANLVACTYYGGPGADIGYFIDLDLAGDVYITGDCPQGAPITSGVYSNPGSANFIAKFNSTLSTLLFSTVVGDETPSGKIIPSAFMVDHCNRIYIGGFGGSANWPLTQDALYTWTIHSQWYLASLDENAGSLLFASSYGSWHVDGGTSRFDPRGIIYQTVCSDSSEFPVTPWAYADGTNTDRWDICAFKIDFQIERDSLLLPNVFTPNNDGMNDEYEVGLKSAGFYEIQIYDRWGAQLFVSTDINVNWDGRYRNKDCPEGVYYVSVTHGYCGDERFTNNGFFHLER